MISNFSDLCISPESSIRKAMTCMERNQKGIVLVTYDEGKLLGTITDGDVRRAMLAGRSMDDAASVLIARKVFSPYSQPLTAQVGTDRVTLLRLMKKHVIRQIPLLNPEGRVAGMVTLDELMPEQALPLQAMVMAGGYGRRLRPLTEDTPKPMLPVGDRPLMELIIDQLREVGIRRVYVSTHYKEDKITSYFGDGEQFGVNIDYVTEDSPLGTAGALSRIETPDEPVLIINGDILTQVNIQAMLAYHNEHRADLTVAARRYDFPVPYGVLECKGSSVLQINEKPTYSFYCNAGIYLLQPSAYHYIPKDRRFDMTELIETLIASDCSVVSFPILEYWLDIGQHADYQQAQEDAKSGKVSQ
jgi:dTDP-glucose pyrophosphorylase/CBS domain-containing protein